MTISQLWLSSSSSSLSSLLRFKLKFEWATSDDHRFGSVCELEDSLEIDIQIYKCISLLHWRTESEKRGEDTMRSVTIMDLILIHSIHHTHAQVMIFHHEFHFSLLFISVLYYLNFKSISWPFCDPLWGISI